MTHPVPVLRDPAQRNHAPKISFRSPPPFKPRQASPPLELPPCPLLPMCCHQSLLSCSLLQRGASYRRHAGQSECHMCHRRLRQEPFLDPSLKSKIASRRSWRTTTLYSVPPSPPERRQPLEDLHQVQHEPSHCSKSTN